MKFNKDFNLKSVPDEVLVGLFWNIGGRIQLISGSYKRYFMTIHRVSDNRIFKSMIDYNGGNN